MIYDLYVVTSHLDGKIMISSQYSIQVAGDPPCITVSINNKNLAHLFIMKSGIFSASSQ
ncbi:MAG: flavin reductase [Promethearchaeota archaeon]